VCSVYRAWGAQIAVRGRPLVARDHDLLSPDVGILDPGALERVTATHGRPALSGSPPDAVSPGRVWPDQLSLDYVDGIICPPYPWGVAQCCGGGALDAEHKQASGLDYAVP